MEKTFKTEAEAHTARRSLINNRFFVSLISYDASRAVYVFDCYDLGA